MEKTRNVKASAITKNIEVISIKFCYLDALEYRYPVQNYKHNVLIFPSAFDNFDRNGKKMDLNPWKGKIIKSKLILVLSWNIDSELTGEVT